MEYFLTFSYLVLDMGRVHGQGYEVRRSVRSCKFSKCANRDSMSEIGPFYAYSSVLLFAEIKIFSYFILHFSQATVDFYEQYLWVTPKKIC